MSKKANYNYKTDYMKITPFGVTYMKKGEKVHKPFDVNYYDLHLTGENVPDTFGIGLNIHIVATVGEYDEASGLFQLKPVSISMR